MFIVRSDVAGTHVAINLFEFPIKGWKILIKTLATSPLTMPPCHQPLIVLNSCMIRRSVQALCNHQACNRQVHTMLGARASRLVNNTASSSTDTRAQRTVRIATRTDEQLRKSLHKWRQMALKMGDTDENSSSNVRDAGFRKSPAFCCDQGVR